MRLLGWGLVVFLLVELVFTAWIMSLLGSGWGFILLIMSFFTGLFMLRRFGLSGVLLALAGAGSGGHFSLYQLLWPVRYALAAILLMIPGFFSSITAVILMLPLTGRRLGTAHQAAFSFGQTADARFKTGRYGAENHEDVIEHQQKN